MLASYDNPGQVSQPDPGHRQWIKILGATGSTVDTRPELYAPPRAEAHPYYHLVTTHRAAQWPVKTWGLRTSRFQEHHVTVERLAKGRAFHDTVQSAFLTDLADATGFRERGWRLMAGGRGRVDLPVVTNDREQMLIIIEIKGTDWDNVLPAGFAAARGGPITLS